MIVRYLFKGKDQADDMTIGREYVVLGIEGDYYRILNDEDRPYLYDPKQFSMVDSTEPEFWVNKYGEDSERYAYPKAWCEPGFFEDYHDHVDAVKKVFWSVYSKYYGSV